MTVGLRVTYYDSDKSALLRECLVPAALRTAGREGVDSAWLHLHWRLGPHCVLYLDGDPGPVGEAAESAAADIRVFLERAPSTHALDPERYAALSERMGRLELVEPPYAPLEPDNSVRWLRDDPVDTFLRSPEAVSLKGRVLTDGLPRVADRIDGRSAVPHVFAGMAAIASHYPEWGLRSGYQAFLSHWKEYFHWSDPKGTAQERLAASYRDQREGLVAALRAVHEAPRGTPPRCPGWTGPGAGCRRPPRSLGTATSCPSPTRTASTPRPGSGTRRGCAGAGRTNAPTATSTGSSGSWTSPGSATDTGSRRSGS
ncbi:lantibiotic dehydratase C-terminal domain-containing protein [Nocardiopsis sp. CNR-923]|uniref:lantibiotic dehydratase C-terminal domain-containing protein n=1 Tax=Nocardiopsis sp. CNR-923 TaxID=1904965 RepID=UPI000AD2CC9D|nr:lantibiotic dehydratase C-terminal domain-containing protein [Nocardiopsis sp. CNR-923]